MSKASSQHLKKTDGTQNIGRMINKYGVPTALDNTQALLVLEHADNVDISYV